MAEATLNDVIARLRLDNEKQLREQSGTTDAINELSGRLTALLTYLELEALKNKEALSEMRKSKAAAKASATTATTADSGPMFILPPALAGLAATLGQIALALPALAVATEGLGPAARDLSRFFRTIRTVFTLPARLLDDLRVRVFGGQTFGQYISRQFQRVGNLFRVFEFDERTGRYRDPRTGRFVTPGFLNNISASISRLGAQLAPIFEVIKNNRFLKAFFRVLRPLAVILSLWEGVENSAAEMEDREGFFNKYLGGGLGGFVSGALGSFFGEFFNLIKWAIFWPIKQILPDGWVIENADGSLSINREVSWFTNVLGGVDEFDFNRLITDLVQRPFDTLGETFDYIVGFFTEDGTSREQLEAYWEEKGIFGAAGDLAGWLLNITFFPINSLLREIETAFFDYDPEREKQTFTQRISGYATQLYEWFQSLIPSIDDVKRWVATNLANLSGPGGRLLAEFMGLQEYLPIENVEQFTRISQDLLNQIQQGQSDISRLRIQAANEGPDSNMFGSLLETALREQREAEAEYRELVARAQTSGNVDASTINVATQQFETFMFPGSGAIDPADIRQ